VSGHIANIGGKSSNVKTIKPDVALGAENWYNDMPTALVMNSVKKGFV